MNSFSFLFCCYIRGENHGVENIAIPLPKSNSDPKIKLNARVEKRIAEMKEDNNDHYFLYNALGVSNEEGESIDVYQNKGRFLYKYAGSYIEDAAKLCFKYAFEDSTSIRIENSLGARPKKFEIDCLVENKFAYEIKWRDATTDGDHINKEHTRMKVVSNAGYTPIRLMFFEPLRDQAIKIQKKLKDLYISEGGLYMSSDDAWQHVIKKTGIDLKEIIKNQINV